MFRFAAGNLLLSGNRSGNCVPSEMYTDKPPCRLSVHRAGIPYLLIFLINVLNTFTVISLYSMKFSAKVTITLKTKTIPA